MTVDYQLEASDYYAFSEERRRLISPSLSRYYYYGVMPVLAVVLALVIQSFAIAIIFTTIYVSIGWLVPKALRVKDSKQHDNKNYPFAICRWKAKLNENGVELSTDAGSVIYRWSFIKSIKRSENYLHFVLTPMQQLHIPIRAFKDESEIRQFFDLGLSYIERNKSS